MFKFENTTGKESFENTINFQGLKIKPIEPLYKNQKTWNITDRFGNEWNVVFTGNVNEFYLYNVPHYSCDKPFRVDFIMIGNNVEIHRALKNGRNIVSDRLLKQFSQLILMVNCFYKFGYMKRQSVMEEIINKIIENCNNLLADEDMVVTEFGKNKDLTLYIHKDCDYNPEVDKNVYNMVFISTKQNDIFVDNIGDIHVTDGSLYEHLERIWNYRNFETL